MKFNSHTTRGMAHLTPYPKKKKAITGSEGLQNKISDLQQRMNAFQEAEIQRRQKEWAQCEVDFQQAIRGRGGLWAQIDKVQSRVVTYSIDAYPEMTNPYVEIAKPVEEVKIEPHIEKIRNPKGYKHDRGFTGHHQHVQYKYISGEKYGDYGSIALSDSIGGCGMQQLYAWTDISSQEVADKLVAEMMKDLHQDTGLIICQVGMNYYGHVFVKALEKVGFTYPIQYKNFTHDSKGGYTQRVYTYQVPDKVPKMAREDVETSEMPW